MTFEIVMLHAVDSPSSPRSISSNPSSPIGCKGGKRKPLQLLSGIFCRKNNREMLQSPEKGNFYLADDVDMWDSLSDGIPEPREALHSPYHIKTIDQDMQNLRLSRQDNPFLQVLASRECLNESDDASEYEEKNLMSKENVNGQTRDPLSLEEVHARLVRSPPPVFWTRSRNSEPSFGRFTSSHNSSLGNDFVFQFPPAEGSTAGLEMILTEPSPSHSCRSHASSMPQGQGRYLVPFKKDNALDILTAKFNLSPQPRRKPHNLKTRPFSHSHFSTSS